jgi:hypothetical protein
MARNEAAALAHVCPGILIHTIDIVQPPGMGISPIAAMDADQATVTAVLAANNSAETASSVHSELSSEAMRRDINSPPVIASVSFRRLSPRVPF